MLLQAQMKQLFLDYIRNTINVFLSVLGKFSLKRIKRLKMVSYDLVEHYFISGYDCMLSQPQMK